MVVTISLLIWLLRAYFMPYANCRRCKGTKVNAVTRSFGKGRRFGPCRKCGGSGHRQVLGSVHVHKAVRGMRGAARNRKG